MACRKCNSTNNVDEWGLCLQCTNVTCSNCGGEKSYHSQLCGPCEKNWQGWNIELDTQPDITDVIVNTLNLAKLKPEYINVLLDHKHVYEKVFTSRTYNRNENYEILEFIGDGILNSFVRFYIYRRFPFLDCTYGVKILDQLRKNYVSKKTFSTIADNLGFWPYIRASDAQKQTDKPSLLEDVLEAFIGATVKILDEIYVVGVGHGVVNELMKSIFDKIHISLEYSDLYDPRSILKEIFDSAKNQLGVLKYVDGNRESTVYRVFQGKQIFMGVGKELPQKADRQQEAARQALKLFPREEEERRRLHNLVIAECGAIVNARTQ